MGLGIVGCRHRQKSNSVLIGIKDFTIFTPPDF